MLQLTDNDQPRTLMTQVTAAGVSIRPARAEDYGAVEALLTASGLPMAGVPTSLDGFLVAEAAGTLVGVVGMEYCRDYGLLRSTAVAPEWRGHRVARRLVEQIIAQAESRGINALYLLTTTAERYFPSFGFRVTSREAVPGDVAATEEFQGACPASATVMVLPLDPARPV
jgi:amino-acid N-acetyltransferase